MPNYEPTLQDSMLLRATAQGITPLAAICDASFSTFLLTHWVAGQCVQRESVITDARLVRAGC